ncbi:homeobox protein NANOG [Patagioenas fasciata monilis]|uniref:Homeobox protein NANOG n=1 Tax=Patagioenas fasciata monilis TaxID=372326 RepID=A0A1V4JAZ6_PATFA|nr:homeobox protein NANOG [Patagioenas fasciata monilis]
MCAHLALPPYQAYPGGPVMGYLEFYWNSAAEAGHAPTSTGPAGATSVSQCPEAGRKRQTAEVSPASSSSGNFSQFTPDSATSPHSATSSPQLTAKSQKGREDGMEGVRKAKNRTAFSKEQLQTLHQRFQSQKYLSPQQIRELAAALGLTYKQSGFQPGTYLDGHPKFHEVYPITTASNIQTMPPSHQHYGAGQNTYTIVTGEDGGVFGKGGGTCSSQQPVGFIAQHKVDFYHSCPGNVEYSSTKTATPHTSDNGAQGYRCCSLQIGTGLGQANSCSTTLQKGKI